MQRDDRVIHEKHGAGVVRRVANENEVTVKFDNVGVGLWIGPASELQPEPAAPLGRPHIKSEAMKQRQIRQTEETWRRWLALAKASDMKGGVRELMEEAVQLWEHEAQNVDAVEKAEKMLELGVL